MNPHQIYQLRRAIERMGCSVTITRARKNEFKEPVEESESVLNEKGLFHTSAGFLEISYTTSGQTFTRKHPKVLMLYSNTVEKHDIVQIDTVGKFEVTGIENPGGLNLCIDLSLEEVPQ